MIATMITVPEPLTREQTRTTPAVTFRPEAQIFEINGISFPEDSKSFYQPLVDYIKECTMCIESGTEFNFKLDYFNTSSARCLLDVMFAMPGRLQVPHHHVRHAHRLCEWRVLSGRADRMHALSCRNGVSGRDWRQQRHVLSRLV